MNKYLLKINYQEDKFIFRQISGDEIIIGSSPFANVHLPKSKVPGIHSVINIEKGKLHITKLHHESKLFVSGKEVKSQTFEANRDEIIIADYKINLINPNSLEKKKTFLNVYSPIEEINTEEHDKKVQKGFYISLGLTILLLLLASFWKVPEEIPLENISERFSRLVIDPTAMQNPLAKSMTSTDGEGAGVKSADKEGTRGSKTAKLSAKGLRQIVKAKGVLGALSNKGVKRQLASVLREGIGFGRKFEESVSKSGLKKKIALYKGTFGSGMKGTGGGGGGTSKDVVGGLATKGVGGGLVGYGKGSVGTRVSSAVIPDEENTIVKGSLERSEIEKVIKRHLPQIRYCYERELKTHPELSGKVVSFFIIGKDGAVSSSNIKESTMKSTSVDNCIARKIARWVFPKPRGGGVVIVKYPFIFSSITAK